MACETLVKLICEDGFVLAGTLFRPSSSPRSPITRPAIVISCATGVTQAFYHPFARYLCSCGCAVLTYDFRGIGLSFPGWVPSQKDKDGTPLFLDEAKKIAALKYELCNTTISTHWGKLDQSAALKFMIDLFPNCELAVVGHSLGGHISGMSKWRDHIKRFVFISVNNAHYTCARKPLSRLLEMFAIPAAAVACGYLPTKRLGLFENLPRDAAREWAFFSRQRDYIFSLPGYKERYRDFKTDILAVSFTDDEYSVEPAFSSLLNVFPRCKIEHVHLAPDRVGLKRVGHMGFFRAKNKEKLWNLVGNFLLGTTKDKGNKNIADSLGTSLASKL